MKIQNKKIPSAAPSITQLEIDLVCDAVKHGWQDKRNTYIDEFIDEFSKYVGVKYCLPTSHCTGAIHLAMLVAGLSAGDEVIVPDLTWVASVSPITYVGATPVFVDVDKINWCISPESFESAITNKTKAVVVVDLLGNMPEWDVIREIASRHDLIIIEDAAEGIGATYKGVTAGNFGDISLFSFSATKLIMSGQGGMFCTNDKDFYDKAKLFSHHGISKLPEHEYYWSTMIGYNYNWTNIQAALALAQLKRIDDLISYKKWLFREYKSHLGSLEGIMLSPHYDTVNPTYWISTVIIDERYGLNKEMLVKKFENYNIDMRPLFYPVSSMPPFREYIEKSGADYTSPVSYQLSEYGICLPNGNGLSSSDVSYVCEALKEILDI